jgi:raffinose/stachyose/melibiose transport system substrate-binding protein
LTTEKWLISNAESNTWPAGQIDFVQGKGAMLLCGSWVPNETFDKTSPDFEFGAFAFPMVEGGKGDPNSVEMETIGWGIPKDAKNPDLAKEFIRFAMQKEYQKKWFSVLYPPARQGLQEFAPPELKDVIDIVSNSTAYHTMFDGVQAEAEYWSKVFLPLNQELLYGRLAPEDFISQIKDETVKFYNK